MRKKLADMTPFERVEQRMIGVSNKEAEEIAAKILGRLLAKYTFAQKKNPQEFFERIMNMIIIEAAEYTDTHTSELVFAADMYDRRKKGVFPYNDTVDEEQNC